MNRRRKPSVQRPSRLVVGTPAAASMAGGRRNLRSQSRSVTSESGQEKGTTTDENEADEVAAMLSPILRRSARLPVVETSEAESEGQTMRPAEATSESEFEADITVRAAAAHGLPDVSTPAGFAVNRALRSTASRLPSAPREAIARSQRRAAPRSSLAATAAQWRRGMRPSLGGLASIRAHLSDATSDDDDDDAGDAADASVSLAATRQPVDLGRRVDILDFAAGEVLTQLLERLPDDVFTSDADRSLRAVGVITWGEDEEKPWRMLSVARETYWSDNMFLAPSTVPPNLYPPMLTLSPSSPETLALRKSNLCSFLALLLRPTQDFDPSTDDVYLPSSSALNEASIAFSQLVVPRTEIITSEAMSALVALKVQRYIAIVREGRKVRNALETSFRHTLGEHVTGTKGTEEGKGGIGKGSEQAWARMCDDAKRKLERGHGDVDFLSKLFPYDVFAREMVNYVRQLYRFAPLDPTIAPAPPVFTPYQARGLASSDVMAVEAVDAEGRGGGSKGKGRATERGGGSARGQRGRSSGRSGRGEGRGSGGAAGGSGGAPPPGGPGGGGGGGGGRRPRTRTVEETEEEEDETQKRGDDESQADTQASIVAGSQDERRQAQLADNAASRGLNDQLLMEFLRDYENPQNLESQPNLLQSLQGGADPSSALFGGAGYLADEGQPVAGGSGRREHSDSPDMPVLRMGPRSRPGAGAVIDPRLETSAPQQIDFTSLVEASTGPAPFRTGAAGAVHFGSNNRLFRGTAAPKRVLNQRTADAEQIGWDSQTQDPTPGRSQPAVASTSRTVEPGPPANDDIPTGEYHFDDGEFVLNDILHDFPATSQHASPHDWTRAEAEIEVPPARPHPPAHHVGPASEQRPGSSFAAMLVPGAASSTAKRNAESAVDSSMPPPQRPPVKKAVRKEAKKRPREDEGSGTGWDDSATDDPEGERRRAEAGRDLVRRHRPNAISPGIGDATTDDDVQVPVFDPDKYRQANQDHWTKEEEELLIKEVEMFYARYDCMAQIIKRHGPNGSISNTFKARNGVKLKDKAVNLSTKWFREGTVLSDLRSEAFGRFPPKQLRGKKKEETMALVQAVRDQGSMTDD